MTNEKRIRNRFSINYKGVEIEMKWNADDTDWEDEHCFKYIIFIQ